MYLTLLLCAVGLEEQMENDRQIYNLNWERRVLCENTGKLLAAMSLHGIGTERNLLNAHYYSLWADNYLNMPNNSPHNKLSQQIIKIAGSLPINEESKKYGAGLVSAVLLKRAADLYQKDVQDREILFWVERSLFTDTLNSKAYYFAGHLYKYGAAGLRRNRNIAKQWFEKATELGSQEGQAALNEIKRREWNERVQENEYRQRREEMKRQKRRQVWAQAIGTLVQAAGSAYLYSQGYSPSNNALNIGAAIHQAQSQYSSRQIPFQNIQMPQFDFDWTKPPTFTVDWSQVNWSSVPIDTYYQYQGDLINNGAGTTVKSENDNSSFINAGSSFEKTCPLCHGTKKCWTCYGKRTYINPLTNKEIACPNCSDGLCSKCHGSGKL